MTEQTKYTPAGIGELLEPTPNELRNVTFTNEAMFDGVRRALLMRAEEARLAGQVYWERGEVIDRPVDIDGLTGKVRYIPSFAYRRTIYDQRPVCQCSLCDTLKDGGKVLPAPATEGDDFMNKFNTAFAVCLNNFPYLDGQMLVASRAHRTLFTDDQYRLLFNFMAHTQFAGAGMQLEGSGATIPEHAHISIFNEALPIFSSDYRTLREADDASIAASTEHPSACYKIYGDSADANSRYTTTVLGRLAELGLSFNLYLDRQASAYVIPRTNRRSKSMDMKVGLSLPAGTHNGYVEHSATTDPRRLREEIWQHCQEMTGNQLALALRETTVQAKEMTATLYG